MTKAHHPASWQRIWRENRIFFIAFLIVFGIGLGVYLGIPQGDDVLFFNQRRTAFGDFFFRYGTMMGEEMAYLLVGAFLMFYSYRHLAMVPVIGLVVTIVAALLKNLFSHPRPFRWFQENGLDRLLQTIEGVSINMGANSFPSGHTMSAFALFTFLALCLPRKRYYSLFFLLLPLLVGISRIYLIKHFLKDVLLGALIGVILGVVVYRLQYWLFKHPHPWLDGHFSIRSQSVMEEAEQEVRTKTDRSTDQ